MHLQHRALGEQTLLPCVSSPEFDRPVTPRGMPQVVGSSLVYLPSSDAGGIGPKLESWAYAADLKRLDVLTTASMHEVY